VTVKIQTATPKRYAGEITGPAGFFRQAEWHLRPEGVPDIQNVLNLINQAKKLEPTNRFPSIHALKEHTTKECMRRGKPLA